MRFDKRTPSPDTAPPSKCPACNSASIVTTSKVPDAESYWRCERCGEVWNASRFTKEVAPNRWR